MAVFRPTADADYSAFARDRLCLANTFRPELVRLQSQGYEVAETPEGVFALTLVQITRSKIESLGLVAQALHQTKPGGLIIVDGSKTDGIESILKRCKSTLEIEQVVAKSHGKLFWMIRPTTLPEAITLWQDALAPSKNSAGFLTAPGMFSPDKVDAGSALLANHFDQRLKGNIADLGAGWGWLSAQALAKGNITSLDLFEAEKNALDVARVNITDTRAQFFWEDVRHLTSSTRYDAIICNPPFHQGRAAEPAIGLDFIRAAASLLKPSGKLWLVANRQLPYEAGLDQFFGHWKPLDETHHFKALLATKPLSGSSRTRRSNPVMSR